MRGVTPYPHLSPGAPATATWDDVLGSLRAVIIAVANLVPEQDLTNAWELAGRPGSMTLVDSLSAPIRWRRPVRRLPPAVGTDPPPAGPRDGPPAVGCAGPRPMA